VLVLRWFLDGTRLAQLARDNGLSASTAYRYLHEGLAVLAAGAPGLSTALERAKAAGLTHLNLDGTVIRTATTSDVRGVDSGRCLDVAPPEPGWRRAAPPTRPGPRPRRRAPRTGVGPADCVRGIDVDHWIPIIQLLDTSTLVRHIEQ